MKVSYVLLISLLIVGALFVPAVSADEIVDETLEHWSDTGGQSQITGTGTTPSVESCKIIRLSDVSKARNINYIGFDFTDPNCASLAEGTIPFTWTLGPSGAQTSGSGVYRLKHSYSALGAYLGTNVILYFYDWDIGTLTGTQFIYTDVEFGKQTFNKANGAMQNSGTSHATLHRTGYTSPTAPAAPVHPYKVTISSYDMWKNQITVSDINYGTDYNIALKRLIDGKYYQSTITVVGQTYTLYSSTDSDDVTLNYRVADVKAVNITAPTGRTYHYPLGGSIPTDPSTPTVNNRTGTVTMTDHNGTSISGFEVTVENFYTGQSYTFSTDTDVAVISLPMDRTTTIRNPQTGVYEEAPVGYYKFYGHAPGYKMVNEDGIQVAVMPQKYGSYQLCDIVVTSESGYLTGQHKFQIRSRSDNSILQTGTISAQSATTGAWYNTTVSGGIATLILPYDTSNSISQYAGNYYVYATSPGYVDSEYGTQIVVMPHTVSEINTVLLTPIGGIPTTGNVTLRILAFSETGPGVPDATIFIAGVVGAGSSVWDTYTASSTGYLEVSVPGNSTYDIVASGAGYYDSARRVEVFTEDPGLIEIKLYLSGAPTVEPTTQPTGWPTTQPTTQPTGGIPDDDDGSESFLMQAVRGIGLAFGVGFSTAKLIFGMLLALSIGFATAKHLRGGAAEFGLGLVGGTMLGVLIGLLPVWTVVVLLLIVGLYIGNRYIGGTNNG